MNESNLSPYSPGVGDALEKSRLLEEMQRETISGIYSLKEQLQSGKPHLPAPWEEHFSEAQGIPYYYNPETGVSCWEHPAGESLATEDCEVNPCDTEMTLSDLVDDETLSVFTDHLDTSDTVSMLSSSSRRVEDDLISKGEMYQSRREELRRAEEAKYREENTGHPQITKYASKLYANRSDPALDIAERSRRMLAAKKAKEDKLREEIERREAQEMRHAPVITKKSKQLHQEQSRGVDAMMQWEEGRKARQESRQREMEEAQIAEMSFRPTVTKQSEKILRESGRRDADDGLTVEERLLEYEEKKRLKHIQAVQKLNMEARARAARPRTMDSHSTMDIGRRGSSPPSHEPASERLYQQAEHQRALRESRRQASESSKTQDMFKPKINKTSARLAQKSRLSHVPVEARLEYRGQLYNQKQQVRQDINEKEAISRSNTSKINPNSAKIIRESGSGSRLTQPIGSVKKKTLDSIEKPSFQPSITKKSQQLFEEASYGNNYYSGDSSIYSYEDDDTFSLQSGGSGSQQGPQRVYERSQKWLQEKQLRILREKAAREEEELRECSFKPKVRPVEKEARFDDYSYNDDGYSYSSHEGGKSLADRQTEWLKNRDKKLEAERRAREEELLAECSFAPTMIRAPGGGSSGLERYSDDEESYPSKRVPAIGPRSSSRTSPNERSPPIPPPPGPPPDTPPAAAGRRRMRKPPPPPGGPGPYEYQPDEDGLRSAPPFEYAYSVDHQSGDGESYDEAFEYDGNYELEHPAAESEYCGYADSNVYGPDDYCSGDPSLSDKWDQNESYDSAGKFRNQERRQYEKEYAEHHPSDEVTGLSAYFSSAVVGAASSGVDMYAFPSKSENTTGRSYCSSSEYRDIGRGGMSSPSSKSPSSSTIQSSPRSKVDLL